MRHEEIRFGSHDELIKEAHLRCLNEGKGALKDGLSLCLERRKTQGGKCSSEAEAGKCQ